MLLRLHVCLGQLLCVYDLLPRLRLAGAGGESAASSTGARPSVASVEPAVPAP